MASPLGMIENVGSAVVDETTKLKDQSKQAIQSLLTFEDLPEWMQGDPYIRGGYRKQLNSLTECFESLFYLHNESVNIWSHLLGGVFFFALLLTADYSIFHTVPEIALSDAVAVQFYLAGATGCLFLSVSIVPVFELRDSSHAASNLLLGFLPLHHKSLPRSLPSLSETGLLGHCSQHNNHVYICCLLRTLCRWRPPSRLHFSYHRLWCYHILVRA